MTDYAALLKSQGIQYRMGPFVDVAHGWDSGWVPAAVAALSQDSLRLPSGQVSEQKVAGIHVS